MFSRILKNHNDQSLIKHVRDAARLVDFTAPTPVKETFSPLRLADGVHLDRAAMDTCAHSATNFLGITVGLNDGYHHIRDGIYASGTSIQGGSRSR